MESINFSGEIASRFLDSIINQKIVSLRTATTEGDTSRLKCQLASFSAYLVHDYAGKNITYGNYSSHETAGRVFSQFLQYFLNWMIEEKENKVADYVYIKNLLLFLLSSSENMLFYNEFMPELWIDPLNKETLLLALCRTMDEEVLNSFLNLLLKARGPDEEDDGAEKFLDPAIKAYFLNMNNAGDNALSVTFLPEQISPGSRLEIQDILLTTAKKLNPEEEKNFWTQFLFQPDEKNRTFLIRTFDNENYRTIETRIKATLNSIKALDIPPSDGPDLIQTIFLASDINNFTALDYAIHPHTLQGKSCSLLLKISKPIFSHQESLFENWINSPKLEGNLPIISATKNENIDCIKTLFMYSFDTFKLLGKSPNHYFNYVFLHQNNTGYTLLSAAIATGNVKILQRCLQILTNYLQDKDVNIPFEALVNLFSMKTSSNLSLFDLALHAKDRRILKTLLDYINFYLQDDIDLLNGLIPLRNSQGTATYPSLSEIAQLSDKQLASLFDYDNATETSAETEPVFLSTQIPSYTLPICSASTSTSGARAITRGFCSIRDFPEEFNQPIAYEKIVYPRETDLANTLSFLSSDIDNLDLNSFKEVNVINLRSVKSHRESTLMDDFNQKIKRSYDEHGVSFLEALQTTQLTKLPTNAAGKLVNNGPVLLDNGINFMLIKDNRLFSSKVYDCQKSFPLKPNLKRTQLESFIVTYFGKNYKIYALTEPLLETYLPFFRNLKLDVSSDSTFINGKIAGITRKNIQRLFLINNFSIDFADVESETIFFNKFDARSNKISFISKEFPKIFFSLNLEEKNAFRRLLIRRKVSIDVKGAAIKSEKTHLVAYGNKIIDLLRSNENLDEITPANLLKITVETYQKTDAFKLLFNSDETIDVISAFDHFNTFVTKTKSVYFKTSLQLSVLLLPNAIRAINEGNPGELAIPLAEIAGDVALRKLLFVLIHHPSIQRLATGTFAEKALQVLDEKLDFLPIIGPFLSFYGIASAIKGLMRSNMADSERRYHAMSLAVHLSTLAYIGLEMVTPIPFFLTLSVYSALTSSQVLIEGERLHEERHLTDDRYSLLELQRSFELGLSISDKKIELVKLQRFFLEQMLKNLIIANKKQRFYLIALILPDYKIEQAVSPITERLATLSIPKKISIKWEFTAAETLCEKKDALYIENPKIPYSLIASNQDPNCYLGIKSITPIQITIDSEDAAAGLFLDKLYPHESNMNKAMLILVDTQVVQHFSVYIDVDKFLSAIELESPNVCTKKLVCGSTHFDELDKLIIHIGQFYKVKNESSLEKISVDIHVNTQESVETSFFDEVEFNLLDTKNLAISTQGIHRKKLNFLEKNLNLFLQDNLLFKTDGFLVALNKTQDLTLVLTESSSNFWGNFRPGVDKKISIPTLRGRNPEQLARFDATECENYSIGLAAYGEYIDKNIHVVVASNFSTPMLYLDRSTDGPQALRLARPINEIKDIVTKSGFTALFQFFDHFEKNTAVIDLSMLNETLTITLYGEYFFENKAYPAVINVYPVNYKLKLSLELDFMHLKNEIKTNLTLLALLSVLNAKKFEKITLLKAADEKENRAKLHHYYLHESYSYSDELPVINGNFERYVLKEMLDHWTLKLQHKNSPDITEAWLSENIDKINIQGTTYEINHLRLKLYAISNSRGNQYPIDASQLVAPIKIDQSAYGLKIFLEDDIIQVNDKKIANYTQKTQLQLINPSALISLYIILYSNLGFVSQTKNKTHSQNFLHSSLVIESKPARTEPLEKGSPKGWFLNKALGVVSVGGTIILVMGAGIISCFFNRRSSGCSHATLVATAAVVTIPLLRTNLAQALPSNKQVSDYGEIVEIPQAQNDSQLAYHHAQGNNLKNKTAGISLGAKSLFFDSGQKKSSVSVITQNSSFNPLPFKRLRIEKNQQTPSGKRPEALLNLVKVDQGTGACIKWFFGCLFGKQSFAKRITQAEACNVASEDNAKMALDNVVCALSKGQEKYGDSSFSFIRRVG